MASTSMRTPEAAMTPKSRMQTPPMTGVGMLDERRQLAEEGQADGDDRGAADDPHASRPG